MGEFDFDVVSDMDELLRLRQPPKPETMDATAGEDGPVRRPETPEMSRNASPFGGITWP
jgi:hypothetical protein